MAMLRTRTAGSRLATVLTTAIVTAVVVAGGVALATVGGNSVGSGEIINNSVRSVDLKDNNVRSVDIQNGTIVSADIANGAVKGIDIKDGTVTGADIGKGQVDSSDLADAAQPAAAAHAFDDEEEEVTNTTEVVLSDQIDVPSPGNLIVTASWYWTLGTNEQGLCSVSLDSNFFSDFVNWGGVFGGSPAWVPGSVTGMFTNVSAGPHTVNLVCGANPTNVIEIDEMNISTIFVPGSL